MGRQTHRGPSYGPSVLIFHQGPDAFRVGPTRFRPGPRPAAACLIQVASLKLLIAKASHGPGVTITTTGTVTAEVPGTGVGATACTVPCRGYQASVSPAGGPLASWHWQPPTKASPRGYPGSVPGPDLEPKLEQTQALPVNRNAGFLLFDHDSEPSGSTT